MAHTLKNLVSELGITAKVVSGAPANPDFRDSTGYTVTLRFQRRRLTVPFYMGSAHTSEPTAYDVLYCLLSDASGVENSNGFEEWASEYGYDTDSIKAQRTYKACERIAKRLRTFLDDQYDTLAQADQG